jgi:hypothetical protein
MSQIGFTRDIIFFRYCIYTSQVDIPTNILMFLKVFVLIFSSVKLVAIASKENDSQSLRRLSHPIDAILHPETREPLREFCLRSSWEFDAKIQQYCFNSTSPLWMKDQSMIGAKKYVTMMAKTQLPIKSTNPRNIFVYIHAHFTKNSLEALVVLDKLLESVHSSGLIYNVTRLYIVFTGYYTDEQVFNTMLQYSSGWPPLNIFKILLDVKSYFELPTLAIMQHHSYYMNEEAKVLYMHTKGVTKFADHGAAYTRALLLYCNVQLFELSIKRLELGWEASSCVFLDRGKYSIYDGNFFWTTAGKIRTLWNVTELVWYWRYAAEIWIFSGHNHCKMFKSNITSYSKEMSFLKKVPIPKIAAFIQDSFMTHPPAICKEV